jgi:mannose-1-phosphate guanylyltransferase/phosphomannomutase
MVELQDRPLISHIFELLSRNAVRDACVTLKYLPQVVEEYVSAAETYGLNVELRTEHEPLGTAGSVKACADFVSDGDFLVISGDCVCDFDLSELLAFHRENSADVTLALYVHAEPLEYGLVVTNAHGRVERFVEKPAWEDVLTDRASTGVYIISPRVLEEIPSGKPYDFARDLLPKLLRDGAAIYALEMRGYWRDVGSPEAYLNCCTDIIGGKTKLAIGALEVTSGIWSLSEIPRGVTLTPPVYIGRDVKLERGADIANSVIGASSSVGANARICGSVILGASIGESAELDGAIVCRNANVGRGTKLCAGSVIGAETALGEYCVVTAGAKVWGNKRISGGVNIKGNVTEGDRVVEPSFTRRGVISGEVAAHISHELCFKLGVAAGRNTRVGIASCGGETARVAATLLAAGANAGGADVLNLDASLLSAARFAATEFSLPLTVFVRQSGELIDINFLGADGEHITHDDERKILSLVRECRVAPARLTGSASFALAVMDIYTAWVYRVSEIYATETKGASPTFSSFAQFSVAIDGGGAANRVLRSALRLAGVEITEHRAGVASFTVAEDGASASATDEDGRTVDGERLLLTAALTQLERGATILHITHDAPRAVEALAAKYNAEVVRNTGNNPLCRNAFWSRDGAALASLVITRMAATGEKLARLASRIPAFASNEREVAVSAGRGAVMRALRSAIEASDAPDGGLSFDTARGAVRIAPIRESAALRIRAESTNIEAAEEIALEIERRIKSIDSEVLRKTT